MNFKSFDEFWPFYLSQHSKPWTRRWHAMGTSLSVGVMVYMVMMKWWMGLAMVPILGYGMAWYSHFFIEGNRPATFGHPLWSFICDWKMFGLMLSGQLDKELKRLGKRPISQKSGVDEDGVVSDEKSK